MEIQVNKDISNVEIHWKSIEKYENRLFRNVKNSCEHIGLEKKVQYDLASHCNVYIDWQGRIGRFY